MKRAFLFLLLSAVLFSCTEQEMIFDETVNQTPNEKELVSGRLVFPSKESVQQAIEYLKAGNELFPVQVRSFIGGSTPLDTSVQIGGGGNVGFNSLYMINRYNYMNSLTDAERAIIENDEDGLTYCMPDSVIEDFYFSKLVNEAREIEVEDSVYKYFKTGVAVVHKDNAEVLVNLTQQDFNVLENGTYGIRCIIPDIPEPETPSGPPSINISGGLTLKDGTVIPQSNVRTVDYFDEGDGGWFHNLWTGIWGRSTVVTNHFSNDRRMRLSFYDQDYKIYSSIGTEVNMQKKVLGIWWNTKAQDIRSGWDAVEVKYDLEAPLMQTIAPELSRYGATPDDVKYTHHAFPFQNTNVVLLDLPFGIDVTTGDLNNLINAAISTAGSELSSLINGHNGGVGAFHLQNNYYYAICGPWEEAVTNTHTVENKFVSECLIENFEIGFRGIGSLFSFFMNIECSEAPMLSRGAVYGAVKYNGQWLGAIIVKN